MGDTGTASTSGNGTSRRSSRGRGGVEEAAETRLNNFESNRIDEQRYEKVRSEQELLKMEE